MIHGGYSTYEMRVGAVQGVLFLAFQSATLQRRTAQIALRFFDGLNAMSDKAKLACTGGPEVDALGS